LSPLALFFLYTDYLPAAFMLSATVVVCLLAKMGGIGIAIGVFAFREGSKIASAVCVLTNIPVFAYYGFMTFWAASDAWR